MSVKRNYVYSISLLILLIAIQAVENTNRFYSTKISGATIKSDHGRYRRAIQSATAKCRISQYFDKEEGRCLGVPGGGRVVNTNYAQSCGSHLLKPHCSNTKYYYVCRGSYAILAQCARGQQFENRLKRCVHSRSKNSRPLFIHPDDENLQHVQPPPCKQHGRFPIPGHCNLFYTCESNGQHFYQNVYKCPQNGIYNAEQGMCTFSSKAESCLINTPQTCVPVATTSLFPPETNETVTTEASVQQTETSIDLFTETEYPSVTGATTTFGYSEVTDTPTEQPILGASNPLTSAEDLDLEESARDPETTTSISYTSDDVSTTPFSDSHLSQTTEMSIDVTEHTETNTDEAMIEDMSSTTLLNVETSTTPSQTESDAGTTTMSPVPEALTEERITDIPEIYSESTTDDLPTTTDVSPTTPVDTDGDEELHYTPHEEPVMEEEPINESEEITSTPSTSIDTTPDDTAEVTSTPAATNEELNMDYSTTTSQYSDSEVTTEASTDYEVNESSSAGIETNTSSETIDLNSSETDSVTEYPKYPYSSTLQPEHYNTGAESVSTLPLAETNQSEISPPSTESRSESITSLLSQSTTNKPPAFNHVQQSETILGTNKNDNPQNSVTNEKQQTTGGTESARTRLPITSAITNLTAVLEHSLTKLFHSFNRGLAQ